MYWDHTNKFTIVPYSNGVQASYNKVLIGINWKGRITGGILAHIWDKYYPYYAKVKFDIERHINMEVHSRPLSRSLHSMIVVKDELWTLECYQEGNFNGRCYVYSLPDLTLKSSFSQNLVPKRVDGGNINLRLVCADYKEETDCLLLGSGTADGSDSDNLEAYIFYDASGLKNYTETITMDNAPHTVIDFHTDNLFPDQTTAKLVWSELPDVCYLTTSNLQYCHKLLLGTGTNDLGSGVYNYVEGKRYNGSFKVIQTYTQEIPEVGNKDLHYYNGYLYYSVKYTTGGYRIYKTCLKANGEMGHEMLIYDPLDNNGNHLISGSPEGIVVYNGVLIGAHAGPDFYSWNIDEIQQSWEDIDNKPTTFPPAGHTHTMSEITDLDVSGGGIVEKEKIIQLTSGPRLELTNNKHFYINLEENTVIKLPTVKVDEIADIHLHVLLVNNVTIQFEDGNVMWQKVPVLSETAINEFVFTHVSGVWEAGIIQYGVINRTRFI